MSEQTVELDAEIKALLYTPDGMSRYPSDTILDVLAAAFARAVCGIAQARGEGNATAQRLIRQLSERLSDSVAEAFAAKPN